MLFRISDIKSKLGNSNPDLNSRDWGEEIRRAIEREMADIKAGDDIIILDFTGIKSFNSSIADEVIVMLMKKVIERTGEYYLVAENVPQDSLLDLELVTAHRRTPCLIKENNKKWPTVVYGENASKLENNQRTIYDLVMRLGRSTAREIADLMNKDINTASTYLNKLFKMRLLRRREHIDTQGKQYIYTAVT